MVENEIVPHIDLYNFEDPQYENGKYVLTSPRSLEGCSRLSIKPVELLYRSLHNFQDELLPQGVSLREIYQLFDEEEKERINKLYLCREERDKVLEEDSVLENTTQNSTQICQKNVKNIAQQPIKESAVKAVLKMQDREAMKRKMLLENVDAGSVHRRRTAWTTSIGHKRVTQNELRKRAEQIHKDGRKLMNKGLNKKPAKPVISTYKNKATNKKKQERLKKQQDTNHKSHSNTDVSSIASSSRSNRSLWKDPTADARPIADPLLRQKLQSARSTRVTPRDQKILEIMLKKREDDKKATEKSEKVKTQWAKEREKEAAMRTQTANEKRRSLMEERRKKELQRASTPLQRKTSEENLHSCRDNIDSAAMRAMEAKQRQVEIKRRQSMERRKSVEKRLDVQRKEQEEMNSQILEKQKKELQRAQSLKESKEKEQILKSKFKNYQTRKKTEERINYLKQQSMEDISLLREHIEEKHKAAEHKAEEEKHRREEEHRRKETDIDHKIQLSKENQKKNYDEMEDWRKDLLQYRKMQEKKAEEKARQAVLEKKRRALEDRRYKEKLVKGNMKKLMEQEEEWKADVEATIAMKDAKTKMLQMEKDEMIQESRALAHASQKLREELRSQYSVNDIDRLNKQTQLENKVLNKPMASLNINS